MKSLQQWAKHNIEAARQGDQIAVLNLSSVNDLSKAGDRRAIEHVKAIQLYIKDNPVRCIDYKCPGVCPKCITKEEVSELST